MNRLRLSIRRHAALAGLLVAAALALRVLVPAGFMPSVENGRVVIAICTGYGPMTMAMPGMDHQDDGKSEQAKSPCAFADLALPAIGSADPVLLAAAIRYILALSLVLVVAQRVQPIARLRPPLRGPPLRF